VPTANSQKNGIRQGAFEELTWGPTLDRAVEFAKDKGLRPADFFAALGDRRRQSSRVPLDLLARFLTWAATTSGDFSFGLKLGVHIHLCDLGAYGYLLLNCSTIGEALTTAQRFVAFQQQGDAFVIKTDSSRRLEIHYRAHGLELYLQRQDVELTLAIVHTILQRLAGRTLRPIEVRIQHSASDGSLERHFGCPVVYGDHDNALCYEPAILDTRIRGADPKLLPILTQYVEQELEELPPQSDELARIRWAIRRYLGMGLSMDVVARQCRFGSRTLQRRLSLHGLTFSLLVDQIRQELHRDLVQTTSATELAEALGFCDASGLAKARLRWSRQDTRRKHSLPTLEGT
jgi:AraC-like DNA-binding protein